MTRILFFVFLAFLVWLLVRLLGGRRRGPGTTQGPPVEVPPRPTEAMAQCAWCGAHLPTSNAITVGDGRTYCSAAHRDAAAGS
jgi:uncharacterized protein